VEVAGATALDRVLKALGGAGQMVVVGVPRRLSGAGVDVTWAREDPPGGGPAAGVAAAAPLLREPWVVVLAGDLPLVDAATVHRLLAAASRDPYDGAVLVDAGGRRQHLSVALRSESLQRRAAERDWHGAPMWSLLAGLDLVEVAARGHETLDLDEAADVDHARRLAPDPEDS
jgi:molybdopterin-guanine dinucleotide biosynthesis protein A